jgi:hypothetical protein
MWKITEADQTKFTRQKKTDYLLCILKSRMVKACRITVKLAYFGHLRFYSKQPNLYTWLIYWNHLTQCTSTKILFRVQKLVVDFECSQYMFVCLFVCGTTAPQWVRASSFMRFLKRTHRRTTIGRTPLDEWSARRKRPLPNNTQHSQQTDVHAPGGIRTHSLSRRAASDPRLKPWGHWDRQSIYRDLNYNKVSVSTIQFHILSV